MASLLHETIVELVAEHPELLVPALQEQLRELPVDLEFHRSESTQSQVPPLRLDLGLELRRRDETKPFSSGMVTMRPVVITQVHFPPITDPDEAKRSLERTFLSGLVHASEPVAAEIGRALRVALDAAPDDVGLCYWDTLLAVLGDTLRSTLEMDMKNWKPRSDWGKRFLADTMAKGRTEDRAASIVELLAARGIPVDPPLRQRITTCTDYQLLTQWLRRAATASVAEEVFAQ